MVKTTDRFKRVGKAEIEERQNSLNNYFTYDKFQVHYRYNYCVIDIHNEEGGTTDTLIAGLTKKEVYDALWFLRIGIEELTFMRPKRYTERKVNKWKENHQ